MNIHCDKCNPCPENQDLNYSSEDPDRDHVFCYGSSNGATPPKLGDNWPPECYMRWGPATHVVGTLAECALFPPPGPPGRWECPPPNPSCLLCVDTPPTPPNPPEPPGPPGHCVVSPLTLPDGAIGIPYSEDLICSAGLAWWTILSGSLPDGLALSHTTGKISGTPTTAGTFSFTVQAAPGAGGVCSRKYTIKVDVCAASLGAYWTMDESSGSRVDQVAGVALKDTGQPAPGTGIVGFNAVAGLYSNCLHFYNKGATGSFQNLIGQPGFNEPSSDIPSLKVNGCGYSMCGWLKIVSYGNTRGGFGFVIGPPYLGWINNGITVQFDSGSQFMAVNNYQNFLGLTFPALGTWFFFHAFYNHTTHKYGFSVNNGPAVTGFLSGDPLPGYVTQVSFSQGGYLGSTNEWMIDEFCLGVTDMFTPAQIAYLYNGGSGRTWPITLP